MSTGYTRTQLKTGRSHEWQVQQPGSSAEQLWMLNSLELPLDPQNKLEVQFLTKCFTDVAGIT